MPHVYEIGLHITFDPARALAKPVLQLRIGLFKRGRVENDGIHAVAFEAQAKVAILGHVVGIPGA